MSRAPAFPVYTKDFDTDEKVLMMDLAEEGAYFRLLRLQWREGSIPEDITSIARILRVSEKKAERVWVKVSRCFEPHPTLSGRLLNAKTERVRSSQDAFLHRQASAGRRSAEARKAQPKSNQPGCDPVITKPQVAVSVAVPVAKRTKVPSEPAAVKPPHCRDTWLTPYGNAWRERWGAESEPPWGEMSSQLHEPHKLLGAEEALARWRRFLASKEAAEWARPARFKQGLGQWAEVAALSRAAPALDSGRMTVGEKAMSEAEKFINGGRK